MGKKAKERTEISVAKIGLIGVVLAAILGLLGTVIAAYVGYLETKTQIESPIRATQTAEFGTRTSPTETILINTPELPAIAGTQLSGNRTSYFSLSVDTGAFCYGIGMIKKEIARTKPIQTINKDDISMEGDEYACFSSGGSSYPFHILVTGSEINTPIYISNRMPVRLSSYQAAPDSVDLLFAPIGGSQDYWWFALDISPNIAKMPDRTAWAIQTTDWQEQVEPIVEARREGRLTEYPIASLPTEIEELDFDEPVNLPDFFTLESDELMAFSIGTRFMEPGIYSLQFGIEYIIEGQKNITWTEPPTIILVPDTYYIWDYGDYSISGNVQYDIYPRALCSFALNSYKWATGSTCMTICKSSIDCEQ